MSGLREALVELANRWDMESVEVAVDFVDAMSALLAAPEHRDEVRALIGDKQVGYYADPCAHGIPRQFGLKNKGCLAGARPVYAPREEPTPERCPAGVCRRPAGHEGPHREYPFYVGNERSPDHGRAQ